MLRYRDLLLDEDPFRCGRAILRTRPIYHSSDAAIRGHVFCSFLAPMMQNELSDLCQSRGPVADQVGSVFQAACIALPPSLHEPAA